MNNQNFDVTKIFKTGINAADNATVKIIDGSLSYNVDGGPGHTTVDYGNMSGGSNIVYSATGNQFIIQKFLTTNPSVIAGQDILNRIENLLGSAGNGYV